MVNRVGSRLLSNLYKKHYRVCDVLMSFICGTVVYSLLELYLMSCEEDRALLCVPCKRFRRRVLVLGVVLFYFKIDYLQVLSCW